MSSQKTVRNSPGKLVGRAIQRLRRKIHAQSPILSGSLDSGVSDLGSRHRKHLLAYFRRRG